MKLVVVESPAKAKTINKYLGPGYKVLASYGHVRDLEAKDGAVDPGQDFAMRWVASADRAKQLKAIADEVKGAERLILATDPDREGEAISWHLHEWLKGRKALPANVERVTFNEITKAAVSAAMAAPRALDMDLIDAYRARRALDYLVGFTLSPVLWRKLPGAKSAGRVQSVALRLIVSREREIEAFRAREYWSVAGALTSGKGEAFTARLTEWRGDKLGRFDLPDAATAETARADVAAGRFTVRAVETKPFQRNPAPPFTTSTLQQEAARKLGMTAQGAMRTAQSLYEAGLITYMRTDGVFMAAEAVSAARAEIGRRFGADSVPPSPRVYTAKTKNAQEAHEAIRPTDPGQDGAGLSGEERKLYELIWKRTLASQMASAKLERTTVDLVAERAVLRASGQVLLFPGFLALYQEDKDDPAEGEEGEGRLPRLTVGETPATTGATAEQHFTQPPPRFSEASLVKRLEELGIGRPSTYASILQTLRDREYVRMDAKRFHPEDKGRLVTAFLERYFERYVGYDFTADLEGRLDDVAEGATDWKAVLREFWDDFQPAADGVMAIMPSEVTQALDEFLGDYLFPPREDGGDPRLCPLCALGELHLKGGRSGAFIGCSRYPECRYTRPFAGGGGEAGAVAGPEVLGVDPVSGLEVSRRAGRFGPYFQLGDGEKPARASVPKDIDSIDLELVLKLLALPRTVGAHPESGEPIEANIGRYGPYLKHAGKYARLGHTRDALEIGMNLAVAMLADAAQRGPRRGAAEPLRVLGPNAAGTDVKLMPGRYGPYVTDGEVNASLPKGADPDALTLDEALGLIAARIDAAPVVKRKLAGKPGGKAASKPKAPAKTAMGRAKAATAESAPQGAKPKPASTTPADGKAAGKKAAPAKSASAKSASAKSASTKSASAKPGGAKPAAPKPAGRAKASA